MRRLLLVFLFSVLLTTLYSSGNAAAVDNTISYERLNHFIIVKGKINGSQEEYNFIIDTGGLTFVDKKVAQKLQLKQQAIMAKINTLELSGFQIDNIFCLTTFNFQPFDVLGKQIHGIIGSNLLERYKVTFDFKPSSVTFSTDTASLSRPENGIFLTFRNHPVNNAPLVNFKIGQKTVEGMIDTGQPYPIVFPLESFQEYKNLCISDFIKSKGLMKEWPMTTADYNYLARIKSFEFENLKMESTVCLFGQLPRVLSMPLIGNDFLSQFKLIINYPRDEILMIPYHDSDFKKNVFSIGINLDISKENKIFIKGLWENSTADKANVKVGDIILSFNSQRVTKSNLIELLKLMNDDITKSLTFEITNQGKTRKLKLNKAMLF